MQYTVVLMRSTFLSGVLLAESEPKDADRVYVALIESATDEVNAVRMAKVEALSADLLDLADHPGLSKAFTTDDYQLLAVFAGRHSPVLFGFQPH